MKIPHWAALAAAHINEGTSFFTRKPPKAPLAGVRMAKTENVVRSRQSHP